MAVDASVKPVMSLRARAPGTSSLMPKNITKTVYKVGDFLSWQRIKSLVLSPSFQRRSVWPAAAKSFFIDTIARGHPVPIVFLREQTNLDTLEPMREVVDGQQRLRTLLTYIEPESLEDYDQERDAFEVKKTHNSELAGRTFKQLPSDIRRRILGYEFSVHVLPSDTDDREVLQIFARMNATGVKLNDQELRNAKFYGEFKKTSYSLAYEQLFRWRNWKVFSEAEIARMSEVEETSDLMILMLNGVHGKSQKSIDNIYEKYEEGFPDAEEITHRFQSVMDAIGDMLGRSFPQTVYCRKSMFNTLFTFTYDLMYSLNSSLDNTKPKPLPGATLSAIQTASNLIQQGQVDEELTKVLRGATSDTGSREKRLDFMKQAMTSAQEKLESS